MASTGILGGPGSYVRSSPITMARLYNPSPQPSSGNNNPPPGPGAAPNYGYSAPAAPPPTFRASDGSVWPSQAGANRRNAEIVINEEYTNYDRGLADLFNRVQPKQDATMKQIGTTFDTEKAGLGEKLGRTQAKLGKQRTDVTADRGSALRKVAQDFSRQLRSGDILLGSKGAGDSSATGQMALGLAGAQSNNRADVLSQANQNFSNLDLQETEANQEYNDQLQQMETWRANQEQMAIQAYNDIRTRIEREKVGASLEKRRSLADLAQQAAAGLKGRLAAVNSDFVQASKDLEAQLSATPVPQNPDIFQKANEFQTNAIQTQGLPGLSFGGNLPDVPGTTISPLIRRPEDEPIGALPGV